MSMEAKFAQIVSSAMEAYRVELSSGALRVYWNALKNYSLEDLSLAFSRHVMTSEFAPKPANIIKLIDGGVDTKAQQAWSKAFAAISRVGQYRSVAFDDPLIHQIVEDMGGWVRFAEMTEDEISYRQHAFLKAYAAYSERPPSEYPQWLVGVAERDERIRGSRVTPPMLIGPETAVRSVIGGGSKRTLQMTDASKSKKFLESAGPDASGEERKAGVMLKKLLEKRHLEAEV